MSQTKLKENYQRTASDHRQQVKKLKPDLRKAYAALVELTDQINCRDLVIQELGRQIRAMNTNSEENR